MQLCIFEDDRYRNFEPLSLYRPTFDLICGGNTLREKILRVYQGVKYSLICRSYLAPLLELQNPGVNINRLSDDDYLFINGNILATKNLSSLIPLKNNEDRLYLNGDRLIAVHLSRKSINKFTRYFTEPLNKSIFSELPVENVEVNSVQYVWDLIYLNGSELKTDFEFYSYSKAGKYSVKNLDGVHLVEKNNIIIEEGAKIKPGVVLDASEGPIYISKNSVIFPNAVIIGPAYVGEGSFVKSCATIYKDVSIGKICKVGGEVEESIFLPYTNKQHSGYLGHSYLGSWVNIGADTNCSDLKNNYSSIRVNLNGEELDTGLQFLGLIMGDHSKTAINTMFNTGTVAGFSCNIFGEGFPAKIIPSFSWGGSSEMIEYDIEKSIKTAKIVMARRQREMSDKEEKVFRDIFAITQKERINKGIQN